MTIYSPKLSVFSKLASNLILLIVVFFLSCNYDDNTSGLHYLLDMHDSLAIEAQEEDHTTLNNKKSEDWQEGMNESSAFGGPGSGLRVPPKGTVPRNYTPYLYSVGDSALAARDLKNPLTKTKEVYARGQKQYNIYCSVCHGFTGLGDGSVTPRLADVPSLVNTKIRNWKDGEIYHIMTMGRGRMLPYSAQVLPQDRWAIIQYIRLLQRQPQKQLQSQATRVNAKGDKK